MTTRTRPDEDVLLDDSDAHATQKRQRLSSPQPDGQPSTVAYEDADVVNLYHEDDPTQTPEREVIPPSASIKTEPANVEASRPLADVPAQDARINHNDSSSVRRSTSQVLQRQFATINAHLSEGENQRRASSSRTTSATVPRPFALLDDAASSTNALSEAARPSGGAVPPAHSQRGSLRWSAAEEMALVEFVARDTVLLAWATSPHELGPGSETDIIISLERFLRSTPIISARATYNKLQKWREVYRRFYAKLTPAGRSTRVSAWHNQHDRMLLAGYEADSHSACQWHRLWHDFITLNATARSAGDAFIDAPSSHDRTYAAMPQRSQAHILRPEATNFTFTSQHSSNDSRWTKVASHESSHLGVQGPSGSSPTNTLAAFESRLCQLERQNLLLQVENTEQRQLLDQQKSHMEQQAQQIERQGQQIKRSEQQMERLEQQTERLEQTVERQAQALDRNALALERRAQAAEREAQKLERLEQRIDGQPQ